MRLVIKLSVSIASVLVEINDCHPETQLKKSSFKIQPPHCSLPPNNQLRDYVSYGPWGRKNNEINLTIALEELQKCNLQRIRFL